MNDPGPRFSTLRLFGTALYVAAWPALIFLLAGGWRWVEGWLYSIWFAGLCGGLIAWLYRHDPTLLAERYRRPGSGGQKGWDQVWVYAIAATYLLWVVVMPLDARRFEWTPPWPAWLKAIGVALLLASAALFFRAFRDNTFLSPLVRIQHERKHTLVSTGVYAIVRHPMYLAACLMFLGAPLLLGSAVGIGLAILATFLMAIRIGGEERLLLAELEGYAEYRKAVKYRLIPFVW
jgi:protein-S-isoprenylcysteine O-methyltransferase Ste14